MPLRNASYLEKTINILRLFLENSQKIPYRKNFAGYGLKNSFFDNEGIKQKKFISRKIFAKERKQSLLSSKFIAELPSNDERTKHHYSITPLGICYLYNHLLTIEQRSRKRIFEITNFWIDKNTKHRLNDLKTFEKLLSKLPIKVVLHCLHFSITSVKIEKKNKGTFIYCLENIPKSMSLVRLMYSINDDRIYRISDFNKPFSKQKEINDSLFHKEISMHFFNSFIIGIFYELDRNLLPKYYIKVILDHVTKIFCIWFDKLDKSQKELKKNLKTYETKLQKSMR